MKSKIYCGNCLEIMKNFPDNYIDTIITDPPYGLKFIFSKLNRKKWNYQIPSVDIFAEMLRISKPGAQILCFAGTRTWHRMAINMEDAGWFVNDTLCWLYGQGFPKSVDISYIIDKNKGKFGEVKQKNKVSGELLKEGNKKKIIELYKPYSDQAKDWYGWGTALKPAWEPIILGSKGIEGNYDNNAINYGVCGLWIDGGRVKTESVNFGIIRTSNGRYPTNVLFDEDTVKLLNKRNSRFFYCAKTIRKKGEAKHPTRKPLELMKYLCNITKTPTGGIVLDPYAGSGTTALGCIETKRKYIMIEQDEQYYKEMKNRIKNFKIRKIL